MLVGAVGRFLSSQKPVNLRVRPVRGMVERSDDVEAVTEQVGSVVIVQFSAVVESAGQRAGFFAIRAVDGFDFGLHGREV